MSDAPQQAEPTIKPGTIVKLKSGGPHMTVEAPHKEFPGYCWCAWFAGDEIRCEYFAEKALTIPG